MVRLAAITVEGYKSFPHRTTFELRPLTLLYGRNNAGKSALLRLIPIIADSVAADAGAPLMLSGSAGRDAHYREVLARGQAHRRLSLGLRWANGNAPAGEDRFTFDYVDERDQVVVRRLEIDDADGRPRLRAEARPYPDQNEYTVTANDQELMLHLTFNGLLPTLHANQREQVAVHDSQLVSLTERLTSLRRGRVQWLDSVRARPPRLVRSPGSARRSLRSDGADAPELLLSWPEVRAEVADWYRTALGRDLEVKEVAYPLHKVLLSPRKGRPQGIDLVDTGEGMAQVLPVLVAAALARRTSGQAYLAMEEPESHLHPNAQQALAAHLAELAASENPPITVIETHSRVFLLGVQLAVAHGRLPPEQVLAYWVDAEEDGTSVLTPVPFDELGRLSNWPRSVFAEDHELARKLLELQLADIE